MGIVVRGGAMHTHVYPAIRQFKRANITLYCFNVLSLEDVGQAKARGAEIPC